MILYSIYNYLTHEVTIDKKYIIACQIIEIQVDEVIILKVHATKLVKTKDFESCCQGPRYKNNLRQMETSLSIIFQISLRIKNFITICETKLQKKCSYVTMLHCKSSDPKPFL